MDPFSNIIALLRPHAAISKPITAKGRWGVRYAAYHRPGFALVLQGQCWLTLDNDKPTQLRAGDFVLLPATPAFTMASQPGIACANFAPSTTAVHHGDGNGPPDFRMLGGAFEIETVNASLVTDLLPPMIHLRADEKPVARLSQIVDLICDESDSDRPARDTILERLLEIMLVECLRNADILGDADQAGLLAGMRDPALCRVLCAMHGDVGRRWTVIGLAQQAGMSRSVFAARFQQVLGCAPIEYLARWRMALARNALLRGGKPLERLAEEIGYESASAFSTAFRRRHGSAPSAFARQSSESLASGKPSPFLQQTK